MFIFHIIFELNIDEISCRKWFSSSHVRIWGVTSLFFYFSLFAIWFSIQINVSFYCLVTQCNRNIINIWLFNYKIEDNKRIRICAGPVDYKREKKIEENEEKRKNLNVLIPKWCWFLSYSQVVSICKWNKNKEMRKIKKEKRKRER